MLHRPTWAHAEAWPDNWRPFPAAPRGWALNRWRGIRTYPAAGYARNGRRSPVSGFCWDWPSRNGNPVRPGADDTRLLPTRAHPDKDRSRIADERIVPGTGFQPDPRPIRAPTVCARHKCQKSRVVRRGKDCPENGWHHPDRWKKRTIRPPALSCWRSAPRFQGSSAPLSLCLLTRSGSQASPSLPEYDPQPEDRLSRSGPSPCQQSHRGVCGVGQTGCYEAKRLSAPDRLR